MAHWIKRPLCWVVGHKFYIDRLRRTNKDDPEVENSDRRVNGNCHVCGKLVYAHCGLDMPGSMDGYSPERRAEIEARR